MNLPQEFNLRQDRLGALAVAKAKFAPRAAERWAQEKATGKQIGGCQGSCRVKVVGLAFFQAFNVLGFWFTGGCCHQNE